MKYLKRPIHGYREQISGWLPGVGEGLLDESEVSFWDNEKALELDSSDDYTTL